MPKQTIIRLKPTQLMWLAGLIEGDGCFLQRKDCFSPRVFVAMVDKDTVERFAAPFKVNVRHVPSRKENWQPYFVAQVGSAAALALCKTLYPHMGKRRQHRIDEMLLAIDGYLANKQNRGFAGPQVVIEVADIPSCQETLDLHYLAGILEAEGSFMKSSGAPVLAIKSTDEDVMERVSKILGQSYRGYERQEKTKSGKSYKKIYLLSLRGTRARSWMERLEPLMSRRRRKQIKTAFSDSKEIV